MELQASKDATIGVLATMTAAEQLRSGVDFKGPGDRYPAARRKGCICPTDSVFHGDHHQGRCPLFQAMPGTKKPCEIRLIGETDRLLSELKYVLGHPQEYDQPTMQTVKHHIEDLELFVLYAKGRLAPIKGALPPVAAQGERGY